MVCLFDYLILSVFVFVSVALKNDRNYLNHWMKSFIGLSFILLYAILLELKNSKLNISNCEIIVITVPKCKAKNSK